MAIIIDFTSTSMVGNYNLGHIGEHNATELTVTVPTALSSDTRTNHYRLAFCTDGKTILSECYTTATFNIKLWRQLTLAPRISMQVIAYDSDGEFIGKSEKIKGYFESSVPDASVEADGSNPDLAHEILSIESSVNSLNGSVTAINTALTGKADVNHNHDARYYTKQETNTKLDAKASAYTVGQMLNQLLDKANRSELPTKTSQLTNDSGFITSASVPTKTSELTNDSGFITSASVPTKTSELTNDSGFINDVSNLQPKLTAGENITIENNVISASGGGSSSDVIELYDDESSTDDDIYSTLTSAEIIENKGKLMTWQGNPVSVGELVDDAVTIIYHAMVGDTSTITEDKEKFVTVYDDKWCETGVEYDVLTAIAGKQDSALTQTVTDTDASHYPSSKAVAEYVASIIGNVDALIGEVTV